MKDIERNLESPWKTSFCLLGLGFAWLCAPDIAQAAVAFGDIGLNVAENSKGLAKGISMGGYAAGVGMGVAGGIDMYKASKGQSNTTYAAGIIKGLIGVCLLGLGEYLGSGSATLFGSDQTTGLGELGIK